MNNQVAEDSLLQQLVIHHNFTKGQAIVVLHIVSEYAQEQMPVLRGNIQKFVQDEITQLGKSDTTI